MVLFFRRLRTNVHQVKQTCVGVSVDCNAVFTARQHSLLC